MAGATNAKVYHQQIKNMFSGGSASATNSPLAFMERTSSATEELLAEQVKSNKKLAKAVLEQTGLLKKILKQGPGGGDKSLFTTLAEASLLKRLFNKMFLGAAAIFGFGTRVMKGALNIVKGTGKLFGFAGRALENGLSLLRRAGKPIASAYQKITSFLSASGFLKTIITLGSKLVKLGPMMKAAGVAVRALGKLALPLAALMAALDGIDGFVNASKLLGSNGKIGLYRRLQAAQSQILNGLLIGIPDYLTRKFLGSPSYAKLIDDIGLKFADKFSDFTSNFAKFIGRGAKRVQSSLRKAWEDSKISENFTNMAEVVKSEILMLGVTISTGISEAFGEIKKYFTGIIDSIRDYVKKQDRRNPWDIPDDNGQTLMDLMAPKSPSPMPPSRNRGAPPYARPKERNRSTPKTGRLPRQLLPPSSQPSPNRFLPLSENNRSILPIKASVNISHGNDNVDTSLVTNSVIAPLSPEGAKAKIKNVEDVAETYQNSVAGSIPPFLTTAYSDGMDLFGSFGAQMVKVFSAGASAIVNDTQQATKETVDVVGTSMADMVSSQTADFAEAVLKKLPSMFKDQIKKALDPATLKAISDVIGGTDTAGRLDQLFPLDSSGTGTGGSDASGSEETTPGETVESQPIPGVRELPSIKESHGAGSTRGSRLDSVLKRTGLDKKLAEKMAAKQATSGGTTNTSTDFVDPMTNPEVTDAIKKKFAGKHVPVAIRNNNPGAVSITGDIDSSFAAKQPGFAGVSKRPANEGGYYAKYATPTYGVHAASQLLKNFGKKGINTTDAIVKKWSTDSSAWGAYSKTLKKYLSEAGINPDGALDLNDPNVRAAILKGKSAHESGAGVPTYIDEVYKAGVQDEIKPGTGGVDPTTTKAPDEAYSNKPRSGYEVLKESQSKLAKTRKMPLQESLANNISKHLLKTFGPGYTAEVYSGGQVAKGTPGPRTGSTRHDLGRAGDLIIKGPDGKMISQEDYARFAQGWLAEKEGGIGLQMSGGGIHVDEHKKRKGKFWRYDNGKDGGIPLKKRTLELVQQGLDGNKPNYKMTDEEALAWLQGNAGGVTKQMTGDLHGNKELSDHPMFGALKKESKFAKLARRRPAGSSSSTSTAVSSNRYTPFGIPNADAEAFRTRAGMKAKLGEYGLADKLLGESSIRGLSTPVEPEVSLPPDAPVPTQRPTPAASSPSMQQQGKPPAFQNKSTGNVDVQQAGMPSIETIPSLDELKMLSVNSEALS